MYLLPMAREKKARNNFKIFFFILIKKTSQFFLIERFQVSSSFDQPLLRLSVLWGCFFKQLNQRLTNKI